MARMVAEFHRTSIRVRLVILVLIPMVSLAVFVVGRAIDRDNSADLARSARADAETLAALSELSSVVGHELDVATGFSGAIELGMDQDLVELALGFETDTSVDMALHLLQSAFAEAEARTAFGSPEVAGTDLAAVLLADTEAIVSQIPLGTNTDRDVEALRSRWGVLFSEAIAARLNSLWGREGGLSQSHQFVAATRTAEAALGLSNTVALDSATILRYLLPSPDNRDRTIEIAITGAQVDLALDQLETRLAPSLKSDFDLMVSSEGWSRHDHLRVQLASGEARPLRFEPGQEGRPVAIMGGSFYVTELGRVSAVSEFSFKANQQMVIEAIRLEAAAERDLKRSLVLAVAVGLVVLGGIVVTTRSILGPLKQLKDRAHLISEGSIALDKSDLKMPRDLRPVNRALDDLTASLRGVVRQAALLSRGELEHAELDRAIAGPLGESIQGSVEKLRQLTERLDYQANHDALTGLPNRAALLARLDRNLTGSVEHRFDSTILLLDLDGFKQANDTLGHVIGDEVLCRVTERLSKRVGQHLLARLGGDEFMIVIDEVLDDEATREFAGHLLDGFNDPVRSSAGTVAITTCIGVVHSGRDAWLSPSEVLQRVDVALYEGKGRGPGSLVVFDQALHDNVLNQSLLQSRLRRALEAGELELHYQPILGLDGAIGVEALMRWTPEGEEAIPPDIFIAAAEQSDLIIHIDDWVIDQACGQLAAWAKVPGMSDLSMSINISGRHVSNVHLPLKLAEVLGRYGVDPGRLILEVTETELISNIKQSIGVLSSIRKLGIRLAIDDFGTGYASVAHLRRVDFDRIKIDRAFLLALECPTERSIANLLVSLGVDLNLQVVAEGVETRDQLEWAVQAGCSHVQGHLFSTALRPVDLEQVLPAVRQNLDLGATWCETSGDLLVASRRR